jgi:hypothetical protein
LGNLLGAAKWSDKQQDGPFSSERSQATPSITRRRNIKPFVLWSKAELQRRSKKCRELAEQICAELRIRKPGRLNPRALAEFQVAIERAACVLNEQIRVAEPPKKLHSQIVPIYGGTQGCLPRSSLNRRELERAAKAARVKKAVNHLQFSSAASPIVDRISTPANFQAAPSFLCMRLTCCQQPWRQWLSPGGRTPVIGRERFRDG